jgi:hypothetical protein
MRFADSFDMAMTTLARKYASRKLTHRLMRSVPWIGGLVALTTLGSAIRRKGFFRGTLHTGLDSIPYVGGAKNLVEIGRGRDFFPDRPAVAHRSPGPRSWRKPTITG